MKTAPLKWLFLVCLCLIFLWGCAGAPPVDDEREAAAIRTVRTTPAPISYREWLKRNYPATQVKKKNEENGKSGKSAWSSLIKN